MSIYEITYLARTGRPPERIQAAAHSVDESTAPPTHRFEVRDRGTSTRLIERIDVEDVCEVPETAASTDEVPQSPLPPFARQVSNRAFPPGRRPGSDG